MPPPQIVLITGCSSGVGLELLRVMDCDSYRIVATALPASFDALNDSPLGRSPRLRIRPLDVTDLDSATALVRATERELGPVDILINNAGISYRGVVEDMEPADELRQMSVNYFGPMHLIRECLPEMRRRRRGRIINVSSVGGMMAMPTMASYSASKFALEGASESLWYELRPWDIKVSLVRPGFINSLSFSKVQYPRKRNAGLGCDEYDAHYEHMTRFVGSLMQRTPCTSLSVAKTIYRIARMRRPPLRAAGTPDARLFAAIRRAMPRALYHRLLYVMLPGIKDWGRKQI